MDRRHALRTIALAPVAVALAAGARGRARSARATADPMLTLPERPVPQDGSFFTVVQGTGIVAVDLWFGGRRTPAVEDGGGWLALVGVGQRLGTTDVLRPGRYDVQANVELGGVEPVSLRGAVVVDAVTFPVEAIDLGPEESALLDPELTVREVAILDVVLKGFTPRRLWDGFFLRPAPGPITDVFGSRRSYNGGPASGSHSGVDFGADVGATVRAAAAGQIAHAGPLPVRGNAIYIDHGAGVFTGYCHLSRMTTEVGRRVSAGDAIGNVGATGLVTGPHLHWEVVIGGRQVSGLHWLAPGTGEG